jgi:MFS family permease
MLICSHILVRRPNNHSILLNLTRELGFLVITAKMSDIFGRRRVLNASLVIFIIASIACGVAQTLNQLYICILFATELTN